MNKIISALAILVAFALSSQATVTWAGESLEEIPLQGATAYKYHKTSFFGRDYAGVTIVENQTPQPPILRLQNGSTEVTDTTTTFSRCKERKEGRLTQAYFVGETRTVKRKSGYQDAVNPAAGQKPWVATVGGDGPSTGNLLLPALAIGGGNAAGGFGAGMARTAINTFGGNAAGGTGYGGAGGKVGPIINDNTNTNTNINPIKIDNAAISGSSSSAAAASD